MRVELKDAANFWDFSQYSKFLGKILIACFKSFHAQNTWRDFSFPETHPVSVSGAGIDPRKRISDIG
jgi:hypothetical protein